MVNGISSYSNAASLATSYMSANSSSSSGSSAQTAANTNTAAAPTTVSGPTDTVTLSTAAQTALSNEAVNYDAQFMPTRAGFSADNLALGVTDPSAQPFSQGMPLAQVAVAARAELNTQYAAMSASGQPFNFDSWEGTDWYSLMGNLDRRALYAVSSNQGGLFTQQEQEMASSIMEQQAALGSGSYDGPISLEGKFVDLYTNNPAGQDQAYMTYYNKVSNDEKSSILWNVNYAAAQTSYNLITGETGTFDSAGSGKPENPLLELIEAAMATMNGSESRDYTNGNVTNAQTLAAQPWFQGFQSQLDSAIAETQQQYQTAG